MPSASPATVSSGALSGVRATIVMSTLFALHPGADPPPKVVTENLLRALRLPRIPGAWIAAHVVFGAVLGAGRERLGARRLPFALAVWAAAYATTLPTVGLYPGLTRDDRRRAFASFASHVVFGASLR